MKTNWFKSIAAAVITAFTFAFAPSAEAAVEFLAPVYNTSWDFTSGIAYWTTCSFDEYTEVDEYTTVWYEGTYVVSRDVTIDERITCEGVVDLILKDGATLTARAGIEVSGDYNALTVYAQSKGAKMGALVATGNHAGIGGGNNSVKGGNITINGGKVTAKCTGLYGAGIGGSAGASASDITINGGVVEATGHCGAGIGGGGDGVGEYITINGGKVTAIGGGGTYGGAAGIGGGDNGGGQGHHIYINGGIVTAIAGGNSASAIGNGGKAKLDAEYIYVSTSLIAKADCYNDPMTEIENWGDDLACDFAGLRYATVTPPTVTLFPTDVYHTTAKVITENNEVIEASPYSVYVDTTVKVVYTADDGYVFEDGSTTFVTESFTAVADLEGMPVSAPAAPVQAWGGVEFRRPVYRFGRAVWGISYWEACMTGPAYEYLTGQTTWGTAGKRTWYVVEGYVTIDARITCVGDVKLVLMNDSTLMANAGIEVTGEGNALTVYAQAWGSKMGTLVATSAAASNAGIGGTDCAGGNITISGGKVTAIGNMYAAGIGGGGPNPGRNIVINGGKVTAKSVNSVDDPTAGWAAGIGGGDGGAGYDIVINGGTVDAYCYASGSGIGGGGNSKGYDITINGGNVTAESGSNNDQWNGAGIGGGCNTSADHIYVNGGYVMAIGGGGGNADRCGSGIGGGRLAASNYILVNSDLPVWADADSIPAETPIDNDGEDLSATLKGLRCVTVGTYVAEPEDPEEPVIPEEPEDPVTPEDPETPVVETELVLWEGEVVLDEWDAQKIYLAEGGATMMNAGAYAGQEIRFYITPTGDWNYTGNQAWACDIVGGGWSGVYVQYCGLGCYWDGAPERPEWDLQGNGGYISFTLTQEMLDAASSKNSWEDVFMANGNDAIITKITLVEPKAPVTPVDPVDPEEPEEPVVVHPAMDPDLSVYPYYWGDGMLLWEGEALADEWDNQPYFFVNNAVEVMEAEGVSAQEGDEIRFYITPTEWPWACEIWKGDWSGAYVSYNNDEYDLDANGGYISLTLTQEMLEFAYTKESWSGLFIANADNVTVTKIVHVRNGGEGGGESGGGDIGGEGGGESGGTTPEVPVEDPVDPEPQGIQVGDNAYAVIEDGVCTIIGTGATWDRDVCLPELRNVSSVVIADGITSIGSLFFKKAYKLNTVTGGKDLVSIGKDAFFLCTRLETIDLACTAIPAGLDESVVYRTAINTNSGAGYTIPAISVANHQRMLRGKKSLADAEWTDLGSPEGKNLFETGYNFFKIDLVEIPADVNGSEDDGEGFVDTSDPMKDPWGGMDEYVSAVE